MAAGEPASRGAAAGRHCGRRATYDGRTTVRPGAGRRPDGGVEVAVLVCPDLELADAAEDRAGGGLGAALAAAARERLLSWEVPVVPAVPAVPTATATARAAAAVGRLSIELIGFCAAAGEEGEGGPVAYCLEASLLGRTRARHPFPFAAEAGTAPAGAAEEHTEHAEHDVAVVCWSRQAVGLAPRPGALRGEVLAAVREMMDGLAGAWDDWGATAGCDPFAIDGADEASEASEPVAPAPAASVPAG